MNIYQSILLGLLQGFTEFLPVSSSGHLALAEQFLKVEPGGLVFEVLVHVGTLVAVLIYFRRRLINILTAIINSFFKMKVEKADKDNLKLALYLVIGTIPVMLFGFFMQYLIEAAFASPRWTSGEFIVTGVVLIATIWASDKGRSLNTWNTLAIGVAQAISIMPAISRSGSTIAVGMFSGLSKEKAAEFSFLLSIPAILGATILKIPNLLKLAPNPEIIWVYMTGALVSGVIGYLSIKWLLAVIKKGKFFYFGIYCIAIGVLGLIIF